MISTFENSGYVYCKLQAKYCKCYYLYFGKYIHLKYWSFQVGFYAINMKAIHELMISICQALLMAERRRHHPKNNELSGIISKTNGYIALDLP